MHTLRTIRQTATFRASPHAVYEALMDSAMHSRFSGAAADISREVGGRFTAYDGYIEGTNLELVPDVKIVQQWRAADWTDGQYSKVTFSLRPSPDGTHLTFTQSGVPDEYYTAIREGWQEFYWTPLKAFFDGEEPAAE